MEFSLCFFSTFQFSVGKTPPLCAEKSFFPWNGIESTQKVICWTPTLLWGWGPASGPLIQSRLMPLARGPHRRPLG